MKRVRLFLSIRCRILLIVQASQNNSLLAIGQSHTESLTTNVNQSVSSLSVILLRNNWVQKSQQFTITEMYFSLSLQVLFQLAVSLPHILFILGPRLKGNSSLRKWGCAEGKVGDPRQGTESGCSVMVKCHLHSHLPARASHMVKPIESTKKGYTHLSKTPLGMSCILQEI